MTKTEIIRKWYEKLSFPRKYDGEFYRLLSDVEIPADASIDTYTFSRELCDGGVNFIMFLYFCEELKSRYEQKGIPEEFLLATLADLVSWAGIHEELTGKLGISEVGWLGHHFGLRLFRIGRLQYCFEDCREEIPALGIAKGERVLGIHIPAGAPLDKEECLKSVEMARDFYKKYFPQVDYRCFTCESWLLDDTLKNFMRADANTVKFRQIFTMTEKKESYSILKYSLGWGATPENYREFKPKNSFTEKIVKHMNEGGKFYAEFGYIEK